VNPKAAGFVAGGRDYAAGVGGAAHYYGPALQRRIFALFYGGEEGIHVQM
jgi:hypothetical protein